MALRPSLADGLLFSILSAAKFLGLIHAGNESQMLGIFFGLSNVVNSNHLQIGQAGKSSCRRAPKQVGTCTLFSQGQNRRLFGSMKKGLWIAHFKELATVWQSVERKSWQIARSDPGLPRKVH